MCRGLVVANDKTVFDVREYLWPKGSEVMVYVVNICILCRSFGLSLERVKPLTT